MRKPYLPHASFLKTAFDNLYAAIVLYRPGQADSTPLTLDPMVDVGASTPTPLACARP